MTGNNWAEVPTTLIELGYMTNPDEDLRMNQDSYQKTMATAIADGLDTWFAQMPEEELSMHPSLTGENPDSADTASTSQEASEDRTSLENDPDSENSGTEGDETDGTQNDEADHDEQEGTPAQPTPSTGTPAGTSSGNGTGVSADSANDSE
jgi:N-acetylmuramoyl-L-alanine amidase